MSAADCAHVWTSDNGGRTKCCHLCRSVRLSFRMRPRPVLVVDQEDLFQDPIGFELHRDRLALDLRRNYP